MLSRPCYCSEWAPVVAHYLSQSVTFFRLKTYNSCFKVCLDFQNYDHYSANYVEYPHRPPTPPSPSDRSASPPPQHREPGKFRACFLDGPNDCSQVCPDTALKWTQVVDVYATIGSHWSSTATLAFKNSDLLGAVQSHATFFNR